MGRGLRGEEKTACEVGEGEGEGLEKEEGSIVDIEEKRKKRQWT